MEGFKGRPSDRENGMFLTARLDTDVHVGRRDDVLGGPASVAREAGLSCRFPNGLGTG